MAANVGLPQLPQQEQETAAADEARQDLPRPYKCPVSRDTQTLYPIVIIAATNIFPV